MPNPNDWNVVSLSHKLKEIRENLELSVQDLSELSGISTCTIYRIESGDTTYKVNDATADALADGLAVELHEIFSSDELSHLGRPPHTGTSCAEATSSKEIICGSCHLVTPRRDNCVHCERSLLVAA